MRQGRNSIILGIKLTKTRMMLSASLHIVSYRIGTPTCKQRFDTFSQENDQEHEGCIFARQKFSSSEDILFYAKRNQIRHLPSQAEQFIFPLERLITGYRQSGTAARYKQYFSRCVCPASLADKK